MDRDFSLSNNGDWNQLNKEVKITRTSHNFMQEGIFVPMLLQKEFERLKRILDHLTVQHAVFLGDLFHSPWNRECDEFEVYLQQFKDIALLLNIGNHDIFHEALLHQLHVYVEDYFRIEHHFILSHEPLTEIPIEALSTEMLSTSGYTDTGSRETVIRLPCFALQDNVFILPAFDCWMGLYNKRYRLKSIICGC